MLFLEIKDVESEQAPRSSSITEGELYINAFIA